MRALLLLVLLTVSALAAPAGNQITSLPGLDTPVNFSQYAGYINVDTVNNRNLFYWFVESQNDPVKDPLLVWMNGGPGASSLMGLFTEHGPFRPNSDGQTLSLNPYSWNRIANIIYLEAPAGVGFSYSDNKTDYTTNDNKTALDNYAFLLGWFQQYPEFRKNDFYVTGESYGGHYCPELSALILAGNAAGKNSSAYINMKGILVGNPGTENDWYFNVDEYAFVTFMYTHGLIPEREYEASVLACGWDDFLTNCSNAGFLNPSPACVAATTQAVKYIPKNMDLYDVYAPICQSTERDPLAYVRSWNGPIARHFPASRRTPKHATARGVSSTVGGVDPVVPFDPCLSNYMVSYLNIPAVQSAIHALPTKWHEIGNINYQDPNELMNPFWAKFIVATDWRILVYSGDADSAVPFIGTQRWIQCLNSPIVSDWQNWDYEGNVAGSYIEYQGISFLTIKGAGHMVPYYAPELAYHFYSRWLEQKKF